jgi:nitroimidazol reductase NimA-like FMN-containing flavoprotein (pyridoxamine 5'-phosphate oxidase superfamily)
MRKQILEIIDKDEIKQLLKKCRVGRLATLGEDGYPYVTPLNYVYFKETVYFHCALKGEKLTNISRHEKVGFEVDIPLAYLDTNYDKSMPPCEVGQFYQSVVIRGRAEIVDHMEEKIAALNALMASHENRATFSDITVESKAVALCHVVAVRIDSVTAKANLAQKKSAAEKKRIAAYLRKRGWPGDKKAADRILEG